VSDRQTTKATIGARPHTVRVLERVRRTSAGVVTSLVLEWREQGQRRRLVIPPAATKREWLATATAQARAVHARLVAPSPATVAPAVVTVAQVYEAYVAVRGVAWRPSTRKLAAEAYRAWSAFAGAATDVTSLTGASLATFRAELVRTGRERANAVRVASRVRTMFRTAVEAGVLERHPIATMRLAIGKDDQATPVPEFTPEQAARLVAQLDPRQRTQWRAWAMMMLAGILGPRVTALRLQTWANVDLTRRVVRWAPETDKLGRERYQALPRAAVYVLRVVRVWQRRERYDGPLLFPSPQKPGAAWTYAALWLALGRAARQAGVVLADRQAMHAWRRYAANEVLRRTGGDLTAVAYWLGDKDLRVLAKSYLRERPEDGRRIAATISGPLATENGPPTAPRRDRPVRATTVTSSEE
jgi:integrase